MKSHGNFNHGDSRIRNDSGLGGDLYTQKVKNAMLDYFDAEDFEALIPHMYPPKFNKTFFARFTYQISQIANSGDEFGRFLFFECGQHLANHVLAFDRHFKTTFGDQKFQSGQKIRNGEKIRIPIVCEGSVWLSWNLMRSGFVDQLKQFYAGGNSAADELSFRLMRPKVTCSLGAARLAAENFGLDIKLNFMDNVELLDDILWMEIKN